MRHNVQPEVQINVKKNQRTRSLKAVIFDMDGLMIDTEPIYKRAFEITAAELGYPFQEHFFFELIGRPDEDCKVAIAEYYGPDFPINTYWSRWPEVWKNEVEVSGISVKPGLHELLDYLNVHMTPTALATSSIRKQALFCLNAAGITHRFDQMVTGEEVLNGKPAPDIYLKAAQRLGISPHYCIALEDSEAGVMAAHQAGMETIMVPDLKQPSGKIRRTVDLVAESLHEATAWIRDRLNH